MQTPTPDDAGGTGNTCGASKAGDTRGASASSEAGQPVRSVVHAAFDLERTYDAPVARVWKALTDAEAKQKWFTGAAGRWTLIERRMDVRVGGREILKGRWEGGVVSTFDAIYHDVIPSVARGSRTTLKVTEQDA